MERVEVRRRSSRSRSGLWEGGGAGEGTLSVLLTPKIVFVERGLCGCRGELSDA
jgi:hypothetical protein